LNSQSFSAIGCRRRWQSHVTVGWLADIGMVSHDMNGLLGHITTLVATIYHYQLLAIMPLVTPRLAG